MIQLVTPERHEDFADALAAMRRLRYRVFKKRLDWGVEVSRNQEVDRFDALQPAYLLQRGHDGEISGCVRLLPSSGPTMLRDVFSDLLDGGVAPPFLSKSEQRLKVVAPGNCPTFVRLGGLPARQLSLLPVDLLLGRVVGHVAVEH